MVQGRRRAKNGRGSAIQKQGPTTTASAIAAVFANVTENRVEVNGVDHVTYSCPFDDDNTCTWSLRLIGFKPRDGRLGAALLPHQNVHARRIDGCPLELDRLHVIDREEWWITKRGQVLHVSEMRTLHIIDAVQILVRYALEGKIDTFVPWWEDIEELVAPKSELLTETDLWKSRTYKALICELVKRGVLNESDLLYHRRDT